MVDNEEIAITPKIVLDKEESIEKTQIIKEVDIINLDRDNLIIEQDYTKIVNRLKITKDKQESKFI